VLAAEKERWLQEQLDTIKSQERQMKEDFAREKELWSSTVLRDTLAKEKELWTNTEMKELLEKEKEAWLQTEVKELVAKEKQIWLTTEVKELLAREKQVWLTTELPVALKRARQSWQENELRTALRDARQTWETEQLEQAVEAAREHWRDTELKEAISRLEEKHSAEIEAAASHQGAPQAGADVEQRMKALTDTIASLMQVGLLVGSARPGRSPRPAGHFLYCGNPNFWVMSYRLVGWSYSHFTLRCFMSEAGLVDFKQCS